MGTDPNDPTDPFVPFALSGTITYEGLHAGPIYVVARRLGNGTPTQTALATPGIYALSNLAGYASYELFAFVDLNGNAELDLFEDVAVDPGAPFLLSTNRTSADLHIPSIDRDEDGLPDGGSSGMAWTGKGPTRPLTPMATVSPMPRNRNAAPMCSMPIPMATN